ncbi:MAG TPA: BTAD domain-containing putative transcriptional regulator [Candidatus Acidoferrales bacterium]|jgi:DNA-binding SARP family transcriptional activator|nr:BTAD domain-containing putative transcriptional regulator [Candidatus Acidoferrales bacterium]
MAGAQAARNSAGTRGAGARLSIRLLGGFRLVKDEHPLLLRPGGKAETLLVNLALRLRGGIEREELLGLLWPTSDEALAAQSLHTLVHELRVAVGDALGGAPPVVRRDGRLCLNLEDGISVDIEEFEARAAQGDSLRRAGDDRAALPCYEQAADLYGGDLVIGSELRHLLERERLRARYLEVLGRLAENRFQQGDFTGARDRALELLGSDPCREDAHRMVMRCCVRLGQRAQALRQYQTCERILEREFGARPEPATAELYDLVRSDPRAV